MGLEIIAAGLQYNASKDAASAQKEAAYEANQTARDLSAEQMDLYKQIYNEQKAQQAPYLQQGQAAIGKLGSLMGGTDPFEGYLQRAGLQGGLDAYLKQKVQYNDPFEGYLQRAGLQGGLDAYLKQKVQYNDPFESYLQRAGLQGGLDAYLKQKGISNYGFLNSPQYQFLQKQGQQALDRSAAARGMGYSGAQMKAAQQYGQGLASQQYDNEYNRAAKEYFNKYDQARGQFGDYYNRLDNEYNRATKEYFNKYDQARGQFGDYYNRLDNEYSRAAKEYFNKYDQATNQFGNYYNRLAALAQGGQQAVQATGNQGAQYGQNVGGTLGSLSTQLQNNIGQFGNARASGYIGQANAITGGLQQINDNAYRLASMMMGGR